MIMAKHLQKFISAMSTVDVLSHISQDVNLKTYGVKGNGKAPTQRLTEEKQPEPLTKVRQPWSELRRQLRLSETESSRILWMRQVMTGKQLEGPQEIKAQLKSKRK